MTAVCVPAAFLNPNGFLTLYILAAYKQSSLMQHDLRMAEAGAVAAVVPQPAASGAAAVLVWQRRRTRMVDWLLLGLFGAAYFSAVRNSNLVGLVAPVLIASYLPWKRVLPAVDGLGGRRASAGRHRSPVRTGARFSTALLPSGNIPRAPPIFCWRTTSRSPCSRASKRAAT